MIEHGLIFWASTGLFRDAVGLWIGRKNMGATELASPLAFTEVSDRLSQANPTLLLEHQEAQQLIDALWSAGLRPTEAQQSHGQFAAQGRHLEDMRALAFGKLNVEKPQ